MDETAGKADPPPTLDDALLSGLEASVGAEGVAALMALVPETVSAEMARLDAAFAAGDLAGARRAAHAIKGFAGNLGLARLGAAATALDVALRLAAEPGALAKAGPLHGAVGDAAAATLAALSGTGDG